MADKLKTLQFSDLPLEIRRLIWSFAIPLQPRVIKLTHNYSPEHWTAEGTIPSELFRVCREFSEVILGRYERSPVVLNHLNEDAGIYVDYQHDTILLRYTVWTWIYWELAGAVPDISQQIHFPLDCNRIRSLAIVKNGGQQYYNGNVSSLTESESVVFAAHIAFFTEILPKFPNLKEFFRVIGLPRGARNEDRAHLVDQSELYEDAFIAKGRQIYMSIFGKVVEQLKHEGLCARGTSITLKILVYNDPNLQPCVNYMKSFTMVFDVSKKQLIQGMYAKYYIPVLLASSQG